jgi:hypothetical protein
MIGSLLNIRTPAEDRLLSGKDFTSYIMTMKVRLNIPEEILRQKNIRFPLYFVQIPTINWMKISIN